MAGLGLTVGQLAKQAGLARSTLLYYERLGLLRPTGRSGSNYRLYSQTDVCRLEQICVYRQMGIPLKEIAKLLEGVSHLRAAEILRGRLSVLGEEIAKLRKQQRLVLALLQQKAIIEDCDMITKDRWVAIMSAAGMSEADMLGWHVQFEKMEPDAHQEFLESLGIDAGEIDKIRKDSRRA